MAKGLLEAVRERFDCEVEPLVEGGGVRLVAKSPSTGNEYRIRHEPGVYLGAIFSSPPLEGEDWRRGGDLTDGADDERIAKRILAEINELEMFVPRGQPAAAA